MLLSSPGPTLQNISKIQRGVLIASAFLIGCQKEHGGRGGLGAGPRQAASLSLDEQGHCGDDGEMGPRVLDETSGRTAQATETWAGVPAGGRAEGSTGAPVGAVTAGSRAWSGGLCGSPEFISVRRCRGSSENVGGCPALLGPAKRTNSCFCGFYFMYQEARQTHKQGFTCWPPPSSGPQGRGPRLTSCLLSSPKKGAAVSPVSLNLSTCWAPPTLPVSPSRSGRSRDPGWLSPPPLRPGKGRSATRNVFLHR